MIGSIVRTAFLSVLILWGLTGCHHDDDSTLYSGMITDAPDNWSKGELIWGDSINQLCSQWSIAVFDESGWFYGTEYTWSNADVFVLEAPLKLEDVVAAENLGYTSDTVRAEEGDTVIFRGRNGYFGAWEIDDVTGDNTDGVFSGTWYFQSAGGGDFSGSVRRTGDEIAYGRCEEL